jgi:hypothetical protein
MKRNSQKKGHSGETAKGVLRLGVVTMASVGLGHQFCDRECCDDYDRQPVDCGGISRAEGGWIRWRISLNKQVFSTSPEAMSRLHARAPAWSPMGKVSTCQLQHEFPAWGVGRVTRSRNHGRKT